MKIKRLKLNHFRRFSEFEIEFDEQLTVLVARNGAGKSSVLDAIATLLGTFLTRLPKVTGINPKDTDFQVFSDGKKPPYMRIACETYEGIAWDRTEKRDQTKKTAAEIPEAKGIKELNDYVDQYIDADNEGEEYELPVFIYYGTGRGVFDPPPSIKGFNKVFRRFDAFSGGLESRANFKSVVEYFYALEKTESDIQKEQRSFDVELPELKAIRNAISTLLPNFSNPKVARPAGIQVDWKVEQETKQLRIEQLSDGYRISLAMVMDIAGRMAEANPDMSDPLQATGIVMIDEVDLHLHPGWQQTILLDLMRTFPNLQFIVSTHSPQVISSVKPHCLRVINWDGEQPSVASVAFSEGAEAQQVLLDVLGLTSARADSLEIVQDLKEYQKLVAENKWDDSKALELRKKLDAWGAEYEPELARLDIDIKLREMERSNEKG